MERPGGSRSGPPTRMAVHEDTVSPVWGTPDMDSSLFQLRMPVVAVSKPCGEKLIRKLKTYEAEGKQLLRAFQQGGHMRKNVALPIAEIPGKEQGFCPALRSL